MKKLSFFIALAFVTPTIVSSQSCLPDGISFTTQAEIDSFQANYHNCSEIEGNVSISGGDITNLNGLSVLTAIGVNLQIYNNGVLTSLTGLDNLTSIGGYLYIDENDSITSLTALYNLTSIGGSITIDDNGTLISLTGLDNLTAIWEGLHIDNNDALTSLTGLGNVTTIAGFLEIGQHDSLTSLTGLDKVTSISGDLAITQNDALISLTGLRNVTSIGGDLAITQNALLSNCEVSSVCDHLANTSGAIDISDNNTGCNSQAEVEEACMAVGVTDANVEFEFSIYPNPATREIYISVKNGAVINEVNIYNQIGQSVLHEKNLTNPVDVSALPQGFYIVEFASNKAKAREKVMVLD